MSVGSSGQPTLGRYTLVREIARSNDIVWEGRDPQMNRRVAVKELALPPSLGGQARRDRIERFFREARAAGAMSHPNIVTIYEVGEDHGRYFIAMEYLEGQTLRERVAMGGPISLSEAGNYAAMLCSALQYAHDRGIIHRDIKPDNIHILPGGILKLTDFGIARITTEDQLTIAGQVFGTPSYMSPEQVLGHPIDARSDQFALAIVVYEMVSGVKPFSGDSVPTITYRIIHEQAPHILGAPPAVDAVLQQAMSKDPANRFASVAQFATALAGAIAQGTGSYRPATGIYPAAAPYPTGGYAPQHPSQYPQQPQPQQQTAQYGAQTQYGVAPGMAGGAPQHPVLSTAPPAYAPQPDAYPIPAGRNGDGAQKTIVAVAVSIVAIGSVLIGGGLMLSKAFHNYNGESATMHTSEMFGKATQLYQFGDYQDAAVAFNQVRLTPNITDDMRQKSIQYEVYCYRQLAHKSQDAGDWETANKWYQSALTIAPGDAQTQSELAAIQPHLSSATNAGSGTANPPSDAGAPAFPVPGASSAPLSPNRSATTNDFEAARVQADARAQPFLAAGQQADNQGNFTEAQQQYRKAMEAGPGSPSAIRASQLLDQSLTAHPDNSLIGN